MSNVRYIMYVDLERIYDDFTAASDFVCNRVDLANWWTKVAPNSNRVEIYVISLGVESFQCMMDSEF